MPQEDVKSGVRSDLDVAHDDVGPLAFDELVGARGRRGDPDHVDAGLGSKHHPDPVGDDRMIVDWNDPNGLWVRCRHRSLSCDI